MTQSCWFNKSVSFDPWLSSLAFHFVLIESVYGGLLLTSPVGIVGFIQFPQYVSSILMTTQYSLIVRSLQVFLSPRHIYLATYSPSSRA